MCRARLSAIYTRTTRSPEPLGVIVLYLPTRRRPLDAEQNRSTEPIRRPPNAISTPPSTRRRRHRQGFGFLPGSINPPSPPAHAPPLPTGAPLLPPPPPPSLPPRRCRRRRAAPAHSAPTMTAAHIARCASPRRRRYCPNRITNAI